MTFGALAMVLTWVAILFLALSMSGVIRQVRILARSLPSEIRVHPARAQGRGDVKGAQRLILFVDADCESCAALKPALTETVQARSLDMTLAFRGPAYWTWLDKIDGSNVDDSKNVTVLPQADALFDSFRIHMLPHAIALDEDNRVTMSGPIGSPRQFTDLVESLVPVKNSTNVEMPA